APLYAAVPNLESLTLRSGGSMVLTRWDTKIELPRLKTLKIITGNLGSLALDSICRSSWPTLENLSLQLGSTPFKMEQLQAIFDGKNFPALEHLALSNSGVSDDIARALPESAILRRLETLDLSLGTLGREGVQAMVASKEKFAHLKRLDLSQN